MPLPKDPYMREALVSALRVFLRHHIEGRQMEPNLKVADYATAKAREAVALNLGRLVGHHRAAVAAGTEDADEAARHDRRITDHITDLYQTLSGEKPDQTTLDQIFGKKQ